MTAPNPAPPGPFTIGHREGIADTNAGMGTPGFFSGTAAVSPSPVGATQSLYLGAAGVEPVRIRTVHHRLHRPASHIMKPLASEATVFTYADFLHLAPAFVAVLPLADLSATLDPAVSLVGQLHA